VSSIINSKEPKEIKEQFENFIKAYNLEDYSLIQHPATNYEHVIILMRHLKIPLEVKVFIKHEKMVYTKKPICIITDIGLRIDIKSIVPFLSLDPASAFVHVNVSSTKHTVGNIKISECCPGSLHDEPNIKFNTIEDYFDNIKYLVSTYRIMNMDSPFPSYYTAKKDFSSCEYLKEEEVEI